MLEASFDRGREPDWLKLANRMDWLIKSCDVENKVETLIMNEAVQLLPVGNARSNERNVR